MLAASLVAALRRSGRSVRALKPVLSGLDEPAPEPWPHDHVLLARAAGGEPDQVAPVRFGPAVSPHLAAELAGRPLDPAQLSGYVRAAAGEAETLIVEGVGGLLVPLAERYLVADLARESGLPLVVAAAPGLGTINHTLLTLEAARRRGLHVAAVVLTPWPGEPGAVERDNRATIERLGEVEVASLRTVAGGSVEELAAAGAELPIARWLGEASLGSAP